MAMERLFELMQANGVRAAQVARDTGISSGNLSDWKHGRSKPSAAKITMLARYFGVTTDYLLGNDPNPTPDPSYDALTPAEREEKQETDGFVPPYPDMPTLRNPDEVTRKMRVLERKVRDLPPDSQERVMRVLNSSIDVFLAEMLSEKEKEKDTQ